MNLLKKLVSGINIRIPRNLVSSIGIGILVIFIIAINSLVAAIPTYFVWNWIMPTIFGIKVVTFWQMWGINFLAGTLFKSRSYINNLSPSKKNN